MFNLFSNQRNLTDIIFDNFYNNNNYYITKTNTINTDTNIRYMNDQIEIEILVPGYKKEEIKISIYENILSIIGENDDNKKTNKYFKKSFEVSYKLSNYIEINKIMAKQEDGILIITLPYKKSKPEEELKKIEIKID